MNHTHQPTKREYISPKLVCTLLDNSISLELQSEPPIGPGEDGYNLSAPEHFNNNPVFNA
jgi:hypothetical protein